MTSTGVELSVVVPSPSPPLLLSPQHLTAPALVRAHVKSLPALIATTPLPSALTSTGVELSVVVPFPSCPEEFEAQHWTPPALVSAHVCSSLALIALADVVASDGCTRTNSKSSEPATTAAARRHLQREPIVPPITKPSPLRTAK